MLNPKIFFICTVILAACSLRAHATIELVDVQGESRLDTTTSQTVPIIYGGTAGDASGGECSSADGDVCDNCVEAGSGDLIACNTRRIKDSTTLKLSFKSDSTSGYLAITDSEDQSITATKSTSASVPQGQTASIKVQWQDICSAIESTNTCEGVSISGSILIGISQEDDNDLEESEDDSLELSIKVHEGADATISDCTSGAGGICSFTAFPGDKKVFIESLEADDTFPNTGQIKIEKLRFLHSKEGFDEVHSNAKGQQEVNVTEDSEGFLTNNSSLTGLNNGTTYFFRVGTVDQAKNLGNIIADSIIEDACCSGGGCSASSLSSSKDDDLSCPYIATPSEVVGVLTKDLNCFVATAAYGSALAAKLDTFRQFKRKILLASSPGRSVVLTYYRYGPRLARFIHDKPLVQSLVRGLLWPAWVFAWMSLRIGVVATSLMGLMLGVLGTAAMRLGWTQIRGTS